MGKVLKTRQIASVLPWQWTKLYIPSNINTWKEMISISIWLSGRCTSSRTPKSYVIWMSHWRRKMVDGDEFRISCKRLKILRNVSYWQLILPSCGVNESLQFKFQSWISIQVRMIHPKTLKSERDKWFYILLQPRR